MKPLWTPTAARVEASHLAHFQGQLAARHQLVFADYDALHQWSLAEPELFWREVWRYAGLRGEGDTEPALEKGGDFFTATWFPGLRLNVAENLLAADPGRCALVGILENGTREELSYGQLRASVLAVASRLRALGVTPGDRVAGLLPNIAATAIAALAATAIGAVWTSCSPDFGVSGVVDRFGQTEPRVLISCTSYLYNGKRHHLGDRVAEICARLPSLVAVILVPLPGDEPEPSVRPPLATALSWGECLATPVAEDMAFTRLPFAHPLYILYSSGTTGAPKCIVHGAGGTLLQHAKEYLLHFDVHPEDRFFYYTTCGWTMWNILLSSLVTGCTAVLYDGSPFYPHSAALLDLVDRERISHFGVSAKYLVALEKAGLEPARSHRLDSLKTLLSTGSPLSAESFRYVYSAIKGDVCLSSICGGTDIISAFVNGSPTLPVYAGELQCKGLGMAVDIWDETGHSVSGQKGELVCTQPFPSAPLGFWRDSSGERYRKAYFSRFPGVWAQGDFGEITASGGFVIHGRSDAVLNPGGVRIGTAEIYRQVEKIPEVVDAVCIGQHWQDDVRVVLFVVLRDGVELDEGLAGGIRAQIRADTTPRHVPAKITQVADIPRTKTGKIAELAVRDMVHGRAATNTAALANPESLALFANLPDLQG